MKPHAQRIGTKRGRHEADGDKVLTPAPSTRSTRSSSIKCGELQTEGGRHARGGRLMVNTGSEPPLLCADPSARKKSLKKDEGGSPVRQPHQSRHVSSPGEVLPNREGSPTRKCPRRNYSPTRKGSGRNYGGTGQSTGANDLVVELESGPLSRPARFREYLQDVSNRASRKWSDSGNLFDLVAQILFDRGIQFNDKFNMICSRIGQFNAFQEEKGHAEIVELANKAQVEISDLDDQCQSLHAATSVLQKELHEARSLLQKELHEARSLLQKETAVLQETVDDLQSKLICRELNIVELETAAKKKSAGHEVERGFPNSLKQMMPIELVSKILSLNEISRVLTVELEKRSQTPESSLKLHPGEVNGREQRSSHLQHEAGVKCQPGEEAHKQELNPLCGSYSDASATPNLLDKAICYAKDELTSFQNAFKACTSKSPMFDKYRGLLNPDVFLARKNHSSLYINSVGNEIFFEGFENESFNALSGVSRFLSDPNLRQTTFYDYYKANADSIAIEEDPRFEEFCKAKLSSLGKVYLSEDDGKGMTFCSFEELCGPQLNTKLALTFRAAAMRVWLLHKLAFSFELPASIFRVERGADIDPNYMETVVNQSGNARSVSKVSFMITPGLRLGKNVMMRAEVYPSAAQTCTIARRSRQPPAKK